MAIKGQQIVITYQAWDLNTASPLAGDVSNHTCRLSIDGANLVTATNTPTELGYGVYAITLTASETNCNALTLQVSSSTTTVVIPSVQITFNPSSSVPSAASIADAVWSDNQSYSGAVSGNPGAPATKGYLLTNPATWSQLAYNSIGNVVSYGDLLKGTATNVSAVKAKTDNLPISPASSADLAKVLSGLLHWTVANNTLTLYDSSNNSLGTYTLTRDSSGNITGVTPN